MKIKSTKLFVLIALIITLPLVSGCFKILSVTQPDTADPGDKVQVTIKVRTDGTDATAHYGIVGLLIPTDWLVDLVRFEGDFGPDTCAFLHPDSADGDVGGKVDFWTTELETRYPSGDDKEWVVYQSDAPYASALDTGYVDVHVDLTVGATEANYALGYFVTNAALDFDSADNYSISLNHPVTMVPVPDPHLLVTEFVVTPTDGEFIEIYNGTGAEIDLSNYYVCDAIYSGDNDYINIVDGTYSPYASDFLAQFPAGATIADGEYQVVATDGAGFNTTYGFDADYELRGTSDTAPDMVSPDTDYIGSTASLSNGGEVIILYTWDGSSDLVQDVDIVVWGDKAEAVDKTGVTKGSSTYLDDTPVADQISVSSSNPHESGKSVARATLDEVGETMANGNGITGNDETSEDLASAFVEGDPTPGEAKGAGFVNVTIVCNTAAWQDTVNSKSLIQLRGTTITDAGQSVDDGSIDTLSAGTIIHWGALGTMYLNNEEGDYWKGTFKVPAGTKMAYKFFVNAQHDTVAPGDEWEHAGWESNITASPGIYSGNRGLDLSAFAGTDTTLPVQFANGWKGQLDNQYETPYTTNDSTFVLWVRVNVGGWEEFDPTGHVLGVRGSNMDDWGQTGELSWGPTYLVTREGDAGLGGTFFSGPIHVPNVYATAGVKFKFVAHAADAPLDQGWDDMAYNPGAEYEISTAGNDTTIYFKYFDNMKPKVAEHPDEIIVHFTVDLKDAVADRGFTLGDTLQVQTGFGFTTKERSEIYLERQGVGTTYAGTDTIQSMIGRELYYQYYSTIGGNEYREVYFNFNHPDKKSRDAERRAITPTSNTLTIADVESGISKDRRMPKFKNVQIIAQDSIVVTLECDVRPAIYQVMTGSILDDIQGFVDVEHPDTVMAWGVAVNGPLSGGWSSPGGDWGMHLMEIANKGLHDDGALGDAFAGDSVFTIQFTMYKDSVTQANGPTNIIGQEFKFGIGGGDNEGGFGNNHVVNVDDSNDNFTLSAQFGSIDPLFYSAWNYDTHSPQTGVENDLDDLMPEIFTLQQNYPNPFNPTTTINYALPENKPVTLKIYNTVGQEIKTLINKKQYAGRYKVQWDGTDNNGMLVSTGLYFYKIVAGDFVKVRKMTLIK